MQIVKSQQHLSNIQSSPFFCKPPLMCDDLAEIATGAELKDQEKLCFRLEGIVQVHNKWMAHVRENITFRLCVANQILAQYFSFAQGFHSVELS